MDKVYCKNCKYNGGRFTNLFRWNGPIRGWKWCELSIVKELDDWGKKFLVGKEFTGLTIKETKYRGRSTERKADRNPTGECSHYKPRWWVRRK